jgi:DNA primase
MKDLRILIEEYGIELKPIGKDIYRGFCKIHNDTGKPNFTYYSANESFYCYSCNVGGDNIRFLAEMEHISYNEAKKRLVGTEAEQLAELKDTLDNLDCDISSSYNLQLNLTLRPKFRDLLYRFPERQQDILMAMKALDEELKTKINFIKMGELFERFKLFSEKLENLTRV